MQYTLLDFKSFRKESWEYPLRPKALPDLGIHGTRGPDLFDRWVLPYPVLSRSRMRGHCRIEKAAEPLIAHRRHCLILS
jgi:hypothetical protein